MESTDGPSDAVVSAPPDFFAVESSHAEDRVIPDHFRTLLVAVEELVLTGEVVVRWVLSAHHLARD